MGSIQTPRRKHASEPRRHDEGYPAELPGRRMGPKLRATPQGDDVLTRTASYWFRVARSNRLDACEIDNLGPFLSFVGNQLSKVRGGTWKNRAAQIGNTSREPGISEARVDLVVENVDDFGRRAFRCTEAEPIARLIARHELAHRRNVRQRL